MMYSNTTLVKVKLGEKGKELFIPNTFKYNTC